MYPTNLERGRSETDKKFSILLKRNWKAIISFVQKNISNNCYFNKFIFSTFFYCKKLPCSEYI